MVSSRLHVRPSVSTRTSTVVPGSSGERSDSGATPERQHRPQQEQEEEQGHLDKAQVAFASELQHHLEEQRRAKKVVAYILMEMRRMWRRREMEANLALRAAVDRFIYHSVLFAWRFERRRVLNLRKLIHLLDRKTGRVSGWVPFYAKDNVLQDRFVWEPAPPHLSRPLRVVHRAMCLARQQRLLPIRIVRQQARDVPGAAAAPAANTHCAAAGAQEGRLAAPAVWLQTDAGGAFHDDRCAASPRAALPFCRAVSAALCEVLAAARVAGRNAEGLRRVPVRNTKETTKTGGPEWAGGKNGGKKKIPGGIFLGLHAIKVRRCRHASYTEGMYVYVKLNE
ncbi:hypothetical protein DQ04_02261010 [Trypanosoma grayi]|uniref:hypothetical protein n=1 Tax=Trypanosoma grayi TaxID=71804 RepID=UPI0004F4716E|nr:hypothetical protein DQ04_02261010 [Trypanosoma grayi]KEG11802.1 hypothetical protein DQ04_02261010 [Trypanosoma grayi]